MQHLKYTLKFLLHSVFSGYLVDTFIQFNYFIVTEMHQLCQTVLLAIQYMQIRYITKYEIVKHLLIALKQSLVYR